MGVIGRARVEQSLSWEHSELELQAAYRRALTGARIGAWSGHCQQPASRPLTRHG